MSPRFQIFTSLLIVFTFAFSAETNSQDACVTYRLVPQTSYKKVPVTFSKMVNETAYETKRITTYKPVWTRETRNRTTKVLKPIVKTSEREERYLVRRPVIETTYRERKIEETSYETVTEMQKQRYLVEKPVVETQMREEKVLVRKPVTTTMMQTENVTTLKPVTVNETQYLANTSVRNDLVLQTGRNRLRWLQPGTYVDPLSGQATFRRRGLHWVPDQTLALQPTIETSLIPHQTSRIAYTPETVQVQKPVQVTQYVDQIETRKVPVRVQSTSQEIKVVEIPVTVQKPVTKIRTEKIPVQEVRYREEIYTRRVPVTETSYQTVEKIEPYDVEVCKWVAETKEIQVPKTVARRVNYSVNQIVPETNWVQVAIDPWGNIVSKPEVVATQVHPATSFQFAENVRSIPVRKTYLKPATTTPIGDNLAINQSTAKFGDAVVVRKLADHEYRENELAETSETKSQSILVPESKSNVDKPVTDLVVVQKPTTPDGEQDTDETVEADESPALDETGTSKPIDPVKTTTESIPTDSTLEIESSDEADIDLRPGDDNNKSDSNDSDDDKLSLDDAE